MFWPELAARHASAADLAACSALLRRGSKTFFAASRLLPLRLRLPATVLYSFCRLADDAADLNGGSVEQISQLRRRLDLIYQRRPLPLPVDRAMADLVVDFALPRGLFEALFEGFAWDLAGRRYETLDDVQAYAARVAGSVGALMSLVMGRRAPLTVARACELGVAMQLTNIARDVGEDARAGRLYLPQAWLREAGIEPDAWLARPAFNRALASVIARLLRSADELYRGAELGIAELPVDCRPGIRAARLLYGEIGAELSRRGLDSVTVRTIVPMDRKLRLLIRAICGTPDHRTSAQRYHPLLATQFLVAAVVATSHPGTSEPAFRWWDLDAQLGRMIELLQLAEMRRQPGRT